MVYCVSVLCAIAAAITIIYALMKEKGSGEAADQEKKLSLQLYRILTGTGFGLLILLRIFRFGSLPDGINQDEAMAAVDALALANYGTDRFGMSLPVHLTGWGFAQMNALESYLMIPFVKVWGLVSWAVRMPSLMLSLLGSAAAWGIARRIFGKKTALIFIFLLAVNPWHMMQSRWALESNLFPHLFVIGLYFLTGFAKKRGYLYISMIFFALCMYSYGVSFYMVPFFLLAECMVLLVNKMVDLKRVLLSAAVYFGISWPIWLTMFINFMGWETVHAGRLTIPYFAESMRAGDILFFAEKPWEQLLSNLRSLLNTAFLQSGDSPWNAIDNFGAVYWCSGLFLLVGLAALLQGIRREAEKEKRILWLSVVLYFAVCILTGLIIANVNTNRINIIFYAQLFLIAQGIAYTVKQCRRTLPVIAAIYGCMAVLFAGTYFGTYKDMIRESFFVDLMAALEKAEDYDSEQYYIAMAYDYNDSSNCAEILTLYAHQLDAKYFQGENLSEISYDQDSPLTGNGLTYTQRYHFYVPDGEEIAEKKDVVYVLRAEHRGLFDEESFAVEEYGSYILVRPKNVN